MISSRALFFRLYPLMCFLVFAYPLWRLGNWLMPGALNAATVVLIWLGAGGALWYAFVGPKMFIRYVMVHWLGAGFIVCILTLIYDIARLLAVFNVAPINFASDALSIARMDRVAALSIVVLGGCIIAGAVAAAHVIKVKTLRLTSNKVTRAHRIVQISDVHIGSRRGQYLARVVRRMNKLNPDVAVITGDLVDSSIVGFDELTCLRALTARAFFCVGNHERYADLAKVTRLLAELSVQPLRQQSAIAGELQFIGIDDADSPAQVAEQLPKIARAPGYYSVLLYHRPVGFDAAREHCIDLMLSGHTHNGQIFPFNLLVKRFYRRVRGLHRQGESYLYVSPGTGTWGPLMRLGSRNEITCIDIAPTRHK